MARFGARTATSVLAIVAVLVVAAPREVVGAITCPKVYGVLNLCISYLRAGGTPPPACCGAERSLLAAERTVQDRRMVCMCVKTAAAGVTGINLANAVALPAKCGISHPYKINPTTDCSRIS